MAQIHAIKWLVALLAVQFVTTEPPTITQTDHGVTLTMKYVNQPVMELRNPLKKPKEKDTSEEPGKDVPSVELETNPQSSEEAKTEPEPDPELETKTEPEPDPELEANTEPEQVRVLDPHLKPKNENKYRNSGSNLENLLLELGRLYNPSSFSAYNNISTTDGSRHSHRNVTTHYNI
ncbi:protein TsetseEP [Zeugodacus cucurbitae]|uniref:protein TsetseEP n=1 Tax=Zeugodacus cucurbitae TaxID=28588 RepID=UPI0023D90671|nr:protein TsetseEP [Zeugodacus cucurbitae]